MADDRTLTGPAGSDGAPGARPVAPGSLAPALGRTSRDLASDQPAGFGPDPDVMTGRDDTNTGLPGDSGKDVDADADTRTGHGRKFNPDLPPDERLGLRPTTRGDAAPGLPAYAAAEPETRAATGAVAGLIGAAALVALVYVLYWAEALASPSLLAAGLDPAERQGLGALGHVLNVLGLLAGGALFGALFGLVFRRPTIVKGMLFALLPTLLIWLVVAPMTRNGLFLGGTPAGLGLPVLFVVLIWGTLLGWMCDRWLRPPYAADTTPRAATLGSK